MKRFLFNKKRNRLLDNLLNHKAILIALIFIILFMLFEIMGLSYQYSYDKSNTTLNTKNMSKEEYIAMIEENRILKIKADLFLSLASTCISMGLLSFAWELVMQRSWLGMVREHILDSLSKPEVAEHLNYDWKLKIINQLLIGISGNYIGKTLFDEIKSDSFSELLMRKNFVYNITISDGNEDFYNARFYIHFTISKINTPLSIRFAKQNRSIEIHNYYQELFNEDDDIYRYILYTNKEKLPENSFEIERFVLSSSNKQMNIIMEPIYPSKEKLTEESIILKVPKNDEITFKKICRNGDCELTIILNTIIDKSWGYFPIMFGYPVKKFSSRFDSQSKEISDINILEFFTSSGKFIRDESIHYDSIAAAGTLDDIILPDSGLVYVWK